MEKEKEKDYVILNNEPAKAEATKVPVEGKPPRCLTTRSQRIIIGLGLVLLALIAPYPSFKFQTIPMVYPAPPYSVPTPTAPEPVGTVSWAPCANWGDLPGSQCGYIIAPKDYFDPSVGTVQIALGKLPATKQPSKGTIFFNPGGPGGAGKPFVTTRGKWLQTYVGDEYDLVGFDPRGIGETRPKTQCFSPGFPFGDYKRNTVLDRSYDFPSNGTLADIRKELIIQQREANALLKAAFAVCRQTMGHELKYMGTATVVRDLDFMAKTLDGPNALINLYGGSYGSILGQYLVNMLPNRIGRVVIDGIADAVTWAGKPSYQWHRQWLNSTENNYKQFVEGCSQAGPSSCPLAQFRGEDPLAIKSRVDAFINDLYYNPLPVSDSPFPGILTSGRAREFLLLTLQRPINWPVASSSIAKAMKGDGGDMLRLTQSGMYRDVERHAVTCNDNMPSLPPTAEEEVDEWLDVYQKVSPLVFSSVTSEPDLGCEYWPVTPPERFSGPWNNSLSNTILVLSNTEDPITPLDSALKVEDLLGDSARLLLQDGPGHCTLALPSVCTASHVRTFFHNGTLPPKGTICKPDVVPFPTLEDKEHSPDLWTAEKMITIRHMQYLHDAMMEAKHGPRPLFTSRPTAQHRPTHHRTYVEPTLLVLPRMSRVKVASPKSACSFPYAPDVTNRQTLLQKLLCWWA